MISELYDAVIGVPGVTDAFDTKLEDGYDFAEPIVIYTESTNAPISDISGAIYGYIVPIKLEVQSADLDTARAIGDALISALSGWSGGPVTSCTNDSIGEAAYDYDLVPPRYVLPVEFTITT